MITTRTPSTPSTPSTPPTAPLQRYWVQTDDERGMTVAALVLDQHARLQNFMLGPSLTKEHQRRVFRLTEALRMGMVPDDCRLRLVPQHE